MNRGKSRKIRLGVIIFLILIIITVVFLFRVRDIEVYGNSRHSSEEIAANLMDSFLMRNTLYLTWTCKDGEIPDSLPYLNELQVQMKSPTAVEVHVTEKEPLAYIDTGDKIFFDEDGIILEISDEEGKNLPEVIGVNCEEPVLYQKLPTESSSQLRTILSLVQLMRNQNMKADKIKFSENMDISVQMEDIDAELGQDEYLEEKIANLNKIFPRLEGRKGVLHLENFTGRNEIVSFSPDNSEKTENVMGGVGRTDEEDEEEGENPDESGNIGEELRGEYEDADHSGDDSPEEEPQQEYSTSVIPMVFNSYGTLVYNVHIENGVVVDAYGTQVPGVTIDEDGNVVDAYMNVIDPDTGELVQ